MTRTASLAVLALALALALPAAADDGRALFDGNEGSSLRVAKLTFTPSPASRPIARKQERSGADLYYFTPEEAQQASQRFGIFEKNDKGYTFDSDVPAEIQKQMKADLAFIAAVKGGAGTPLHQKIFGAVDGSAYKKFFEDRVTGIGMDDCGGGNAVACVIPFMNPSKMWLTRNFIRFSHPQVSRMMVVFHEARHTETKNGNFPHARCPTPFKDDSGREMRSIWTGAALAGEPACDKSPMGSYGSSTIMLKNIQRECTNCTEKVRMDAGLYADDQLGRITNPSAKQQMKEDFAK